MVAISSHEIIAQQFRDQFTEIDGQYYFSISDIDWMLPVEEDIPWKKEKLFHRIYGLMRIVIWALAGGMGLYVIFSQKWSSLLILIPFFIAGTFAHVMAFALPNLDLSRSLLALSKQPDEVRSRLLVRKPETA